MRAWRLVSGIASILIAIFAALLFCKADAGAAQALGDMRTTVVLEREAECRMWPLVSLLLSAAGLWSIAAKKGSYFETALLVLLFGLVAVTGFAFNGGRGLRMEAEWGLACAVVANIDLIMGRTEE